MAIEIDLDEVLLSPAAVASWQELSARAARGLRGIKPSEILDEKARVNDDGTLTIFVKIRGGINISMDVPAQQWTYQD